MSDLDPAVWGPHFWFFLHTIALTFPLNPNAITKRKYYEVVANFPLFIPNAEIAAAYARLLDEYPVEPYLDNRDSFIKWMHFTHNKINERLNKSKIGIDAFYDRYYAEYKPREERYADYYRLREKIVYIAVIVALIAIIYMQYDGQFA